MGTYYAPCSLTAQERLSSHDYGCGSKMSEHGYLENPLVRAVCFLLMEGKPWYNHRIAWVGDSDKGYVFDKCRGCIPERVNIECNNAVKKIIGVCYLQDWEVLYYLAKKRYVATPTFEQLPKKYYIINTTQKLYISTERIYQFLNPDEEFVSHPIPYLTRARDGRWANHQIIISLEKPTDKTYEEDEYNIKEY